MPSVAKVQRQITGSDQLDSLAQQVAVLEVLKGMAVVQIGDPDALAKLDARSSAQ